MMDTIEVPVAEVRNALDAMEWTFNPYLDEPFRVYEYPFIVELILSYNSIAALLPDPIRSQYPLVSVE